MLRGVATEHGLSGQHVDQAAQATYERDPARLAVFVRLPASEFRQQLHVGPLEGDAHLVEEACGHPCQGHQGLKRLPIEHLHLFPAQALLRHFETVFSCPALAIHGKDAQLALLVFHLCWLLEASAEKWRV